jgi:hypothetical protein
VPRNTAPHVIGCEHSKLQVICKRPVSFKSFSGFKFLNFFLKITIRNNIRRCHRIYSRAIWRCKRLFKFVFWMGRWRWRLAGTSGQKGLHCLAISIGNWSLLHGQAYKRQAKSE